VLAFRNNGAFGLDVPSLKFTDVRIPFIPVVGFRFKEIALKYSKHKDEYLPPYNSGFNPIELAFSKLKAALRKAAARTKADLWDVIATAIETFTPIRCQNYFAAA
jgi:transposase